MPDRRRGPRTNKASERKRIAAIRKAYADKKLRDRIAESTRESWNDPEVRKRRERGLKKSSRRPEYRKKLSRASQANWQDPDYQAKVRPNLERTHKSKKRIKAVRKAAQDRWREDPEYREKMIESAREQWTPEKRAARSKEMRRRWRDRAYREKMTASSQRLWASKEHRDRMRPFTNKWTEPERAVRRWLKKMGIYRTGHDGGIGFLPHRWLPIQRIGFSAQGDFVDYNHKIIIHVDGDYWHGPKRPRQQARDRRLDDWCDDHDWMFVRLAESDIYDDPVGCRKQIRELISS